MPRSVRRSKHKKSIISHIVQVLFTLQVTMKLYHWSTKSYARHKASDEFITALLNMIDLFVESYIGKYNSTPSIKTISINMFEISDMDIIKVLLKAQYFLSHIERYTKDSELLALRDELLTQVDKTLYLFRFM